MQPLLLVASPASWGWLQVLQGFFKLNPPVDASTSCYDIDQQALLKLLAQKNVVENKIYRPSQLRNARPRIKISKILFRNVSFSYTHISEVTFNHCTFEDCLFINTHFEGCWFHNCKFTCVNFHKVRIDRTFLEPKCLNGALDREKHTNIGVHLFDQLLKNHRDQQLVAFSREAEFLYWTWTRYRLWHKAMEASGWRRRVRAFGAWFTSKAAAVLLGYSLKPIRFCFWSLVLFGSIAIATYFARDHFGFSGSQDLDTSKFETIAYFVAITISTLGYGDLTPTTTVGMVASAAISVLGLIWLGLLTSLLIKRFVR